jgi:hypothetical protein
MKKVSFFAFALIFAAAVACNAPATEEATTDEATEVVEETTEAVEEAVEATEEVMDTVMEAGGEAMEEMHDHAEGEDHAEHSEM